MLGEKEKKMSVKDRLLAEIPKRQERQPATALGIAQHLINSADLAEDAVLAGCCRNAEYAADALSRLTAGDFDLEWRQTVWQAMVRLNERGERISSTALYPLLGGPLWHRLARATANARNPHEQNYVRMVLGYSRERQATAAMLSRIERAEAIP